MIYKSILFIILEIVILTIYFFVAKRYGNLKIKTIKLPKFYIVVWAIVFLFIILFAPWFLILISNPNIRNIGELTGQIGDTIGGLTAPFINSIAAILVYVAFKAQVKANKQQRDDIKIERFENNFFNMLENHNRMLESMQLFRRQDGTVLSSNRDCFKKFSNYMFRQLLINPAANSLVIVVNNYFDETQDKYSGKLHHYFRFLYQFLKYIKNSNVSEEEKYRYASILRATLSAYELLLLYYNCLHENGEKLKPLVEEFSMLKNLDWGLLLHVPQTFHGDYHNLAFAPSDEREILYPQWLLEQLNK